MRFAIHRHIGLLWAILKVHHLAASPTCRFIGNSNGQSPVPYSDIKCERNGICRKNFNITYIGIIPYYQGHVYPPSVTGVYDAVHDMLAKCCGNCVRYTSKVLQNKTELTNDAINTSDFVFPIFASSDTKHLYGFHYLPYHKAPSTFFITKLKDDFLERILSIWPAVIIIVLLAFIAGFIGWSFETWNNEEEFPRPFHIGLFEGFWWSFVSLTTVGYGDKAPKSSCGRLFATLWIIIGIVAFGILTGDITGQIVKTNSPPPEEMNGKDVGTLRFRDYDTYIVSTSGGKIVYNTDTYDFASDVRGLIKKLMKDEIHGILFDKYTLWIVTALRKSILTTEQEKFFITETLRTEQEVESEALSYGLLIKNTDDYKYFKDFVLDSQLRNAIYMTVQWVTAKHTIGGHFYSGEGENTLFSPRGHRFQNTLIVLCVIIVVISVFGLFYELYRRKILCVGGRVADREKTSGST